MIHELMAMHGTTTNNSEYGLYTPNIKRVEFSIKAGMEIAFGNVPELDSTSHDVCINFETNNPMHLGEAFSPHEMTIGAHLSGLREADVVGGESFCRGVRLQDIPEELKELFVEQVTAVLTEALYAPDEENPYSPWYIDTAAN